MSQRSKTILFSGPSEAGIDLIDVNHQRAALATMREPALKACSCRLQRGGHPEAVAVSVPGFA